LLCKQDKSDKYTTGEDEYLPFVKDMPIGSKQDYFFFWPSLVQCGKDGGKMEVNKRNYVVGWACGGAAGATAKLPGNNVPEDTKCMHW
jgi:hypothetical protein